MAEAAVKGRVLAGLAGFATAFVAWPALAVAVLFVATRFEHGANVLGLFAIGVYGWVVISLTAGGFAAFAGGRAVRGVLTMVGVAIGLYLVVSLVVALA